jgi:hypothetical protein
LTEAEHGGADRCPLRRLERQAAINPSVCRLGTNPCLAGSLDRSRGGLTQPQYDYRRAMWSHRSFPLWVGDDIHFFLNAFERKGCLRLDRNLHPLRGSVTVAANRSLIVCNTR